MGGIDKAGHMWGAQADTAPQDCTTLAGMTHVRCAAENADVQLGKILDAVHQVDAAEGRQTLVVLTADHGATYGKNFLRQDDRRAPATATGTTRRRTSVSGTPAPARRPRHR